MIENYSRNYYEPTYYTVSTFISSQYRAPRGQSKTTYNAVLKEIPRQKSIRKARRSIPKRIDRLKPLLKSLKQRRNNVARSLFTIWVKNYLGDNHKITPNCLGIVKRCGVTLVIDGGSDYDAFPRIWMRNNKNLIKVVVIERNHSVRSNDVKSLTQALVPMSVLKNSWENKPMIFDFENEGFKVDGSLIPWDNVRKVYPGDKAHHTIGKPSQVLPIK